MSAEVPVPFPGTAEEAAANFWTHHWIDDGGEIECMDCCAKIWHVAASYPCGEEPPRMIVEDADAAVHGQMARAAFAAQVVGLVRMAGEGE